jgi:hypothetical protein
MNPDLERADAQKLREDASRAKLAGVVGPHLRRVVWTLAGEGLANRRFEGARGVTPGNIGITAGGLSHWQSPC